MTDSAGLSLILLVEVIETLLTLYRESRDHSTSKKNGKNITRLITTPTVGQHFLTMATDRVRLSSTNAPLASLARCAPVLHDQSGQLKRAAQLRAASMAPGCADFHTKEGTPYGGIFPPPHTLFDFSNLCDFLRIFLAFFLETHFSALLCSFNSLFNEIMIYVDHIHNYSHHSKYKHQYHKISKAIVHNKLILRASANNLYEDATYICPHTTAKVAMLQNI